MNNEMKFCIKGCVKRLKTSKLNLKLAQALDRLNLFSLLGLIIGLIVIISLGSVAFFHLQRWRQVKQLNQVRGWALSPRQKQQLAKAVEQHLRSTADNSFKDLDFQLHTSHHNARQRLVFISASRSKQPALVAAGFKPGLEAAFAQAVTRLQAKAQQLELTLADSTWIKVDVVMSVSEQYSWQQQLQAQEGLKQNNFEKILQNKLQPLYLKPGLDGLIIPRRTFSALSFLRHRSLQPSTSGSSSLSYFLPKQVLDLGLVNSHGHLNSDRFKQLGSHWANQANQTSQIRSPRTFYTFTSDSFAFQLNQPQHAYQLYRGHKQQQDLPLNRDHLLSAASAAGHYLARNVNQEGRFTYLYQPALAAADPDSYNILRHAGSIYSLFQLYQETGDELLWQAGSRALNYLLLHVRPCQPPKNNRTNSGHGQTQQSDQAYIQTLVTESQLCLVDEDEVKLGGNALAMIALTEYLQAKQKRPQFQNQATKSSTESDKLNSEQILTITQLLAEWIVNQQQPNGGFKVHKLIYSTSEHTDFVSGYYPGEASFALSKLYRLDRNSRWLQAAQAAVNYLITNRAKNKSLNELNQDHWLLYALAELHQWHPRPIYLEHMQRVTQAVRQAQQTDSAPYPDWFGGVNPWPSTTTAATRLEGLAATYPSVQKYQKYGVNSQNQQQKIMLATAKQLALFCLQTQYTPLTAMYLPKPQAALGGFPRSLSENAIRIDYVHHNLSGLLLLSQILPH